MTEKPLTCSTRQDTLPGRALLSQPGMLVGISALAIPLVNKEEIYEAS